MGLLAGMRRYTNFRQVRPDSCPFSVPTAVAKYWFGIATHTLLRRSFVDDGAPPPSSLICHPGSLKDKCVKVHVPVHTACGCVGRYGGPMLAGQSRRVVVPVVFSPPWVRTRLLLIRGCGPHMPGSRCQRLEERVTARNMSGRWSLESQIRIEHLYGKAFVIRGMEGGTNSPLFGCFFFHFALLPPESLLGTPRAVICEVWCRDEANFPRPAETSPRFTTNKVGQRWGRKERASMGTTNTPSDGWTVDA
jgi:hypothetical protein